MKHLLTRAYAAQRLVSWRRQTLRQWAALLGEVCLVAFYLFVLALLALAYQLGNGGK